MTMDYAARRHARDTAEKLLRERYNDGREFIDPVEAMRAVRAAAYGYAAARGEKAPEVPAEDILAALSQLGEARAQMDALEADLIRAARMREAPWGTVAQALGLRTRQSAESRALRLERAQKSADGTRDAGAQRQERRCQRAADAWCLAREGRIREVCERLVDASAAWPQEGNPSVAASVHALAAALAAGAGPVRLADDLTGLRWAVAPYDAPFLEPVGKQAADAARACDAMLELLAELSGVRSGRLTADGSPASAVH